MEEFIKTVTYRFNKDLDKSEISDLQKRMKKVEGIISCEISPESIRIDYDALRLTAVSVKETVGYMGYPVEEAREKRKGILSRFIKNLADSNRDIYGSKRLDCCDLKHN